MSNKYLSSFAKPFLLSGLLALAASGSASAADIVIVVADGAGEGFNDPTPADPVGGNSGTTVGEQRLIAFQHAASIWGSELESDVEIRILAAFNPLTCTATSGVLGSAGSITAHGNFPNADYWNTWYPAALANKLAGTDLTPTNDDLVAQFNSNLGQPGCLTGSGWYYGLDNNSGNKINLVAVLLHEFAHGLGFANFVNEASGANLVGLPDVFSQFTYDTTTNKFWSEMTTNAERAASAKNFRRVVWDGRSVNRVTDEVLEPGTPGLNVLPPSGAAGFYAIGTAAFGAPLSSPGVSGEIVLGQDAEGVPGDACTPLVNDLTGKIALVDRGSCAFTVKAANAQAAGAVAVLIANNAAGTAPGLGGSDPSIVVPVASLSLSDGDRIKAELAFGVSAILGVDMNILAGADPQGRALLFAPDPVQLGSSISHWDPIARPNQLMEPSINADLTQELAPPFDLTLPLMTDIGWFSDRDGVPEYADACLGSDLRDTVIVGDCDSGVANPLFSDGCTITDQIDACAEKARNHGAFTSCATQLTNQLGAAGILTKSDRGAILSCVARTSLP